MGWVHDLEEDWDSLSKAGFFSHCVLSVVSQCALFNIWHSPSLSCILQYALEMEAKLDQLRSMVEAADRDKVELLNQLEEEKRWVLPSSSHYYSCLWMMLNAQQQQVFSLPN